MSESPPPPAQRIGDAEREAATSALGTHMQAGRLDAEEYGERSAKVAEARTADDLAPLFVDLPEPHPPSVPAGTPSTTTPTPAPVAKTSDGPSGLARWAPGISAALPIIAVILFFVVPWSNSWVFFLLIPLGGALFAGTRQRD